MTVSLGMLQRSNRGTKNGKRKNLTGNILGTNISGGGGDFYKNLFTYQIRRIYICWSFMCSKFIHDVNILRCSHTSLYNFI